MREIIAEAPTESVSLIGYGGAAGGAKTNLIANLGIDISLECPGARTLIGRQDFIDLQTTTLQEFDRALPPGVTVHRYNQAPIYRDLSLPDWPEGVVSRVYFRGLDDWASLMSEEFGWILIDEAQQVALRAVLALLTRLRHKPEPKRGLVAGFNPFPSWCVDWFMRQDFDRETLALFEKANVHLKFIPSKIADNPHLPPGYQDMLEATLASDPYMKAIMVDGDPDAALGGLLYFDRQVIDRIEALCDDPVERIPTAPVGSSIPDGEVLIWERPMIGERYYGGADTADGKGEAVMQLKENGGKVVSDRNSAAIYKLSNNTQVAAIYGRQEEHAFARLLDKWGREYNDAFLCIERNRPAVLSNLLGLKYPSLYGTLKTVDMHLVPVTNLARQMQWGYDVNVTTRPVFLSQFRETVGAYVMKPRDKRLPSEMRQFMAGIRPEAASGQHDDTVFGHGHADQARRQLIATGRGDNNQRRSGLQVAPMRMR